jgi:hypothetical protein
MSSKPLYVLISMSFVGVEDHCPDRRLRSGKWKKRGLFSMLREGSIDYQSHQER